MNMIPLLSSSSLTVVLPQFVVGSLITLVLATTVLYFTNRPTFIFAYNCFIKPFMKKDDHGKFANAHQGRLEEFYEGQTEVYDTTRKRLLRGRSTMLRLCAGQLMKVYPNQFTAKPESLSSMRSLSSVSLAEEVEESKEEETVLENNMTAKLSSLLKKSGSRRLAWVDIGGGTGSNIERMNEVIPISSFEKVYLVDITPSMCEIARKRFAKLGWTNVVVVCCAAEEFSIPSNDRKSGSSSTASELEIALVTFSYSLSMMENVYPVIDKVTHILSDDGIVGVADFYVSGKRSSSDPTRQLSWFKRWFWSIWFDFDGIYLHPSRREYLEHKFATIKMVSHLNPFISNLVYIPYYVYVGCQKELHDSSSNVIDTLSVLAEIANDSDSPIPVSENTSFIKSSSTSLFASKDSIHGCGMRWREPYDGSLNTMFSTYIYAFAWEDPREDLKYLNLTKDDTMFVMTSGGCNVLEYAFTGVHKIYAVDMNPCQGHMLELKLAAYSSLSYDEFWKLFGEGFLPDFPLLLESKMAAAMSPYAYQFWLRNKNFKNLYLTGCSGLAIKVFRFFIKLTRMKSTIARLCNAKTLEEQVKIWYMEVRPKLLHPLFIKCLNNDRFLWGALGVPENQAKMIYDEGTLYDYVVDTIDPLIHHTLLRNDNYFYYLGMSLSYSKDCMPTFCSKEAFDKFAEKDGEALDCIKIHTDKMINVLTEKIQDNELTKAVVMDHLDWFSEEDARAEISILARRMKVGGDVFWRSAGKHPWYNRIFTECGFECKPIQIREDGKCIDRVNMYASFWVGRKL